MIRKNLVLAAVMSAALVSLPALAQSGTYGGGSSGSSSMNGGGSGSMGQGSMGGGMNGGSRGATIGGPAARTSTYGGTGAAGGGPNFNTLDRGHKGYLTRSDVKSDPSVFRHFSQCDTNGNGKLTRSEFQTCEHKYGDK
ncbi:MAG: EF-hand domain-containing protein [Acidiferrobacteraceae bacterium]